MIWGKFAHCMKGKITNPYFTFYTNVHARKIKTLDVQSEIEIFIEEAEHRWLHGLGTCTVTNIQKGPVLG